MIVYHLSMENFYFTICLAIIVRINVIDVEQHKKLRDKCLLGRERN